jgi:hypothetical protein
MTEPRIIDLGLAMAGADGTRFYALSPQAALIQWGAALAQLWCEYPHKISGVLATTAWAAVFAYFLSEALKPRACA